MHYVDLTVDINGQTPVWPGDPVITVEIVATIEKDGCEMHVLSIGTHAGTHIDAPSHMLEGRKTLDQYAPECFIGRGRLVHIEGDEITQAALEAAGVQAGEIVLCQTGRSESFRDPAYFEKYPAISEAAANYLVEKKVKMVGVDTCSADHEEFVSHKILLKSDVLIIENLTNLQALEGKEFTVYALPIKLQVDGAPARVIAEVKE